MKFELQTEKNITIKQAEIVTLKEVEIERVLDDVVNKKVVVWIKGFAQPIEVPALSDAFYDNPQWTNESLQTSIQEFFDSIPS